MTMTTDEKLTEALERLAARATTPTDGRARVERRLRTRRNRRRTTLGIAAAVGVLGVSAAFASMGEAGDTRNATVASTGEDSTAPDGTDAQVPPGVDEERRVPRLSLTVPGLSLTSAHIGRTEFTDVQLAAPLGFTHLQSFRAAPDDWSGASVYVFTSPPDSPFGIGEEAPDGSKTIVDINGSTGYLSTDPARPTLGWRVPEGTTAFVLAPGVELVDLVTIGRSMALRADGRGWDVRELPDGMVPVLDEESTRGSSTESHSLTFAGEAGEVELHSYTASRVEMEDRIADYSIGAEVTNATVNGYPAAVTRSPHDVRVLWYDADNLVANYLIVDGAIADDIELIVSNIDELAQDEWDDLLANAETTYWTGDESSPTSTP
jgi:hypothetical protein